MNETMEFFEGADLIRVISCLGFPVIVLLGCEAISFRTEKIPDRLGWDG